MIGEQDIFLIVFLLVIVVVVLLALLLARVGFLTKAGRWVGKESRITKYKFEEDEKRFKDE